MFQNFDNFGLSAERMAHQHNSEPDFKSLKQLIDFDQLFLISAQAKGGQG